MKKQLFIIRHGETDLNKLGVVQGRGVDPPLNEIGRKQASLFFDRYRNENFDIIYVSSLKRSIETVNPFIQLGIPFEKHSDLDEISWGVFEGQKMTSEFKNLYNSLLLKWKEGKFYEHAENGESPIQVQIRQLNFINYMVNQPPEKALVCIHGRAMRMFLSTLLGESLNRMDEFPHQNLSLYKLNYDEGRFTIDLFNNTDHLH
ncbi:MAG: histidine phosphatase family protein [Chitinophagales bacterium]|nr:histidine phosphatase family protein [Chitinophagales bacterium]